MALIILIIASISESVRQPHDRRAFMNLIPSSLSSPFISVSPFPSHGQAGITPAESHASATCDEIKAHVKKHTGLTVSTLNIAQVKRKCGIIERECYNKAKAENVKQPQCPTDKGKAIEEALRFFGMIFDAI